MSDESVSGGQTAEEPEERAPTDGEVTPPAEPGDPSIPQGERLLPAAEVTPPVEPVMSPVRFNAIKHGIFSVSPVVPWLESEEDWLAFRDSIFEDLRPEGGLQMALADRVATLLWRMMRIVRFERETVSTSLGKVRRDIERIAFIRNEPMPPPDMVTPGLKREIDERSMGRLLPDEATLNKLMRYEGRLHRQMLQTVRELAALQERRKRRAKWFPVLEELYPPRMGGESGRSGPYLLEGKEESDV